MTLVLITFMRHLLLLLLQKISRDFSDCIMEQIVFCTGLELTRGHLNIFWLLQWITKIWISHFWNYWRSRVVFFVCLFLHQLAWTFAFQEIKFTALLAMAQKAVYKIMPYTIYIYNAILSVPKYTVMHIIGLNVLKSTEIPTVREHSTMYIFGFVYYKHSYSSKFRGCPGNVILLAVYTVYLLRNS